MGEMRAKVRIERIDLIETALLLMGGITVLPIIVLTIAKGEMAVATKDQYSGLYVLE